MIRYMYTGLLSIAFYSRYAISRNCVIKNNNVVKSEEEEEEEKNLACISFLPMMATTSMAFFR